MTDCDQRMHWTTTRICLPDRVSARHHDGAVAQFPASAACKGGGRLDPSKIQRIGWMTAALAIDPFNTNNSSTAPVPRCTAALTPTIGAPVRCPIFSVMANGHRGDVNYDLAVPALRADVAERRGRHSWFLSQQRNHGAVHSIPMSCRHELTRLRSECPNKGRARR